MRLDRKGRNVTALPELWCESDCEIVATQFAHPSITSGLHTNGPASIWIRLADGGDWVLSPERSMHSTIKAWVEMGIEWFQLNEVENNHRKYPRSAGTEDKK